MEKGIRMSVKELLTFSHETRLDRATRIVLHGITPKDRNRYSWSEFMRILPVSLNLALQRRNAIRNMSSEELGKLLTHDAQRQIEKHISEIRHR
jgi:hypothetical protein